MSNSLCKSSVLKTYQDVIGDVIQNVREHFLEDGVDETVLQELKSIWETKLAATKAVEEVKEVDKIIAVNNKAQKLQQQQQNYLNQIAQQQSQAKQLVGQVPPNNHIPQGIAFPEWRRVPVQLTIPSPPGCGTGEQRVLGIEVPEVFLQGHHLKSILTGPIISATLNLPLEAATTFLQDQVNNAFLKHQQSTNFININMGVNPSIIQTDGSSLLDDAYHTHCNFSRSLHNTWGNSVKKILQHDVVDEHLCNCKNNNYRHCFGNKLLEHNDRDVEIRSKKEVTVKFKRKETKKYSPANKKRDKNCCLLVSHPFLSTRPEDQQPIVADCINGTELAQYATLDINKQNAFLISTLRNPKYHDITLKDTQNPTSLDTGLADKSLTPSYPHCFRIYQGDGTHSSSDDDDLDDDDDDDDNDDDDQLNEDIEEDAQDAAEDEPLNSEDDVSDADGTEESFETDNVIVCQFDKITRARNRWKFHLKDGIMNLNGEDYVFQKANGDAEW